jgi:hypothetical protein
MKRRHLNGKRNSVLFIVLLIVVILCVSGCASNEQTANKDTVHSNKTTINNNKQQNQPANNIEQQNQLDTENDEQQDDVGNTGTQGVLNNYVALDQDFSSEPYGYSNCIFTIPQYEGDSIDASATTESLDDFISGDYSFYLNILTNIGKLDKNQDYTIFEQETQRQTQAYKFSGAVNRKSFNLIVSNPSGEFKNIKGHIKVIVHSHFFNSNNDAGSTQADTEAAKANTKYSYVAQDNDFSSEIYGSTNCLFFQYLLPGDVVEATVTTDAPADFIVGDYMLDDYFSKHGENLADSRGFTVYQSESYSNTKSYHLLKYLNRKWYVLVVRNSSGDYQNINGHVKFVVYSKYSEKEHQNAFDRDVNKNIEFWDNKAKEALTPPYASGYPDAGSR